MELYRRCCNCVQHLATLIFAAFGWLLQEISGPTSETAAGASELVSIAAPFSVSARLHVLTLFACKYTLAWNNFSVRSLHVV